MDENLRKRNETLAKTVIKGLKSRNMSGYYAADKEEALKLALELIPEGSTISMGGCASAQEVGLIKALKRAIIIISTGQSFHRGKVLWLPTILIFSFPVPMPSQATVSW